jgi:putative ABC transport system substrate-binding protein
MINRRTFLCGLTVGAITWPLAARAQGTARVAKVGWLSDGIRPGASSHLHEAFLDGLRDLGYVEGRNVVIERRDAAGKIERLAELAADLVKLHVDVIVTAGGGVPTTSAAKRATSSIPIVMTEAGDPVATGIIASLGRPGGNVTGLTSIDRDLTRKRLQLLKEAAPKVSLVAVLYNSRFPATVLGMKDAQAAAPALGLKVLPMEVKTPDELGESFATMIKLGVDSFLTFGDPFVASQQGLIVNRAEKLRLPAIHNLPELAQAGGLMSYGASIPTMYRRAATYVDKILKGAKPGDLPVEQPTKFELIINMKTARALGLTIPPSLLLRADQVIE